MLSVAGLYEWFADPAKAKDDPDRWLWSATIVTTDARGLAGEVHDRTPLILPRERVDAWLDPHLTEPDQLQAVLACIELESLELRKVSPAVNNVRSNGRWLLEPIGDESDRPMQLALG